MKFDKAPINTQMFNLCLAMSFLLLFNCKPVKVISEAPFMSIEKTSCMGPCPEFKVEVFPSGKAAYLGKSNVKNIGKFSIQMSKDKLDSLNLLFTKFNFFDFKESYTSNFSDLPTTNLYYKNGTKEKSIKDYDNAPEQLRKLEDTLIKFFEKQDWKKAK